MAWSEWVPTTTGSKSTRLCTPWMPAILIWERIATNRQYPVTPSLSSFYLTGMCCLVDVNALGRVSCDVLLQQVDIREARRCTGLSMLLRSKVKAWLRVTYNKTCLGLGQHFPPMQTISDILTSHFLLDHVSVAYTSTSKGRKPEPCSLHVPDSS